MNNRYSVDEKSDKNSIRNSRNSTYQDNQEAFQMSISPSQWNFPVTANIFTKKVIWEYTVHDRRYWAKKKF